VKILRCYGTFVFSDVDPLQIALTCGAKMDSIMLSFRLAASTQRSTTIAFLRPIDLAYILGA
jgi:hypothetical protein